MKDHEVPPCNSVNDLIEGITKLCQRHDVTGIAVVLSIQSGRCITTHQYGMDTSELAKAARLMDDYAKDLICDYTEN